MTRKLRTTRNNHTGAITVAGDTFTVEVGENGRVEVCYEARTVRISESGIVKSKGHVQKERAQ